MLAKVAPPSSDFFALASYLVHGRSRDEPNLKRVAWVQAHNLPGGDPELVARCMTATAALSPRTVRAVYHLMISWHPGEDPTDDVMRTIAVETLMRAGLGDHEALIMGHGDTPHRHLHMMINRVHPGTGRAWKTSHDYARFDRIMRELAGEHGFAHAPAHLFDPGHAEHSRRGPDTRAWRAARRGAATNRPQWSGGQARHVGKRLSERIDRASTFEDIAFALAVDGLSLEEKGRGLVVGTNRDYGKFSRLGLTLTAKDLRKRSRSLLVRSFAPPAPPSVFTVDGIDILQALATMGFASRDDIADAIEDVRRLRSTRHSARLRKWSETWLVQDLIPEAGVRRREASYGMQARLEEPSL